MFKILALSLILSPLCHAENVNIDSEKLITACSAMPRLYHVAAMASMEGETKDNQWILSSYEVGKEIMMTHEEVNNLISKFRENKILAKRVYDAQLPLNSDEMMQECMLDPSKRLITFDRMLKAGRLN